MALPVALQIYSVRDDFAKDMEGTLKAVKEMGYDGVEFTTIPAEKSDYVKKLCEDIGLVPVSAHVQLGAMIEKPYETLAIYKNIGCHYVAVPWVDDARRPGSDNFYKSIGEIAKVGMCARQMDMQLLYHNHDFEFKKLGDQYGLDVMYDAIPAELLKTELDMCWVNVGGEEPSAFLRKYTGRAPVVHIKDFNMTGKLPKHLYALIGVPETEAVEEESTFEFRPIGSGMQNIPSILDACIDAGAEWVVVEQDNPSMGLTALECAKKSREYLRSLGW